jgi:hypothetical protein
MPSVSYILQQRLANDGVLAVAYQYTIGDKALWESLEVTVLTQPL